jgi:Tfp pilus assembly protein PilF
MIPIGHASPREMERITALEAKLRSQAISLDEQLELALLYLEPGHEAIRTTELLQEILAHHPEHNLARIWLAYCFIYEWMDEESLKNAVGLCDLLSDECVPTKLRAAALLLKAAALRQLPGGDDPLPLLLQSIELEPNWISNRQMLASVYQERGDRKAAEEQLHRAMEVRGNYANHLFDRLIAGRSDYRIGDGLEEQLRELGKDPYGSALK